MSDTLVKLLFPTKSCRAEVLHMDSAWQDVVRHHNVPKCVKKMLGELTAAATLLSSGLKFEGSLVVQIQGDGPVRLALVEVSSAKTVRATVQLRTTADSIPDTATFHDLVNANGNGRCAMMLDLKNRAAGEAPYQGVVPLTETTVAGTIESFMTQSEQVRTRMWLAAGEDSIGGVLLQHVPATGGIEESEIDPEGFEHLTAFCETVKPEELLMLDAEETAKRLFWEDNPKMLGTFEYKFACRCSRKGIEQLVKSLGADEARDIIKERGVIEVKCEFCGANYVLDSVDVESLFVAEGALAEDATKTPV